MAEIVVSSIVGLVVEKIASGAIEKFKQLAGVEEEVKRLSRTLVMIRAVLEDAEARQFKEKAIQLWLKNLKDVAYHLDDLLDEMMMMAEEAPSGGQSKPEGSGTSNMKPCSCMPFSFPKKRVMKSLNFLPLALKFSPMIAAIQKKLDEIDEEKQKYLLNPVVVAPDRNLDIRQRKETGSFLNINTAESMFYGRDEDMKRIADFLVDDSVDDGCWPHVISIFGLGGLGKTTLAKLAFNIVRERFDKKAMWVCVSNDEVGFFDVKIVATKILESAGDGQRCDPSASMDTVQRSLEKVIKDQKFLLVLDDVWKADQTEWRDFRCLLAMGAKGSKVIVTTRSKTVANIVSTAPVYCLEGLSNDDCWKVFESRAFAMGCAATRTMLLESIGKDIVKKCDGLPLAAEALGSLMFSKKDEREWDMVKHSEIWQLQLSDDVPEILPSLRLSFNHLPARLKACFAYCSILPKHDEVDARILVRLWMAEGLVITHNGSSLMDVEDLGLKYLDELISRSFIQEVSDYGFRAKRRYVKMHDVMHDLSSFIACDECLTIDTDANKIIESNSHFSSLKTSSNCNTTRVAIQFRKAKALRSLYSLDFLVGRDERQEFLDMVFKLKRLRALHLEYLRLPKLSVELRDLKHLRYLNLNLAEDLEELPSCIGDLIHLQTLILSRSGLRSLPESIGRLYNLSYLDLSRCKKLNSLPESIGDLTNLRHLDLFSCATLIQLPESISRLSNLRVLGLECCSNLTKLPESIGDLTNLQHLDLVECHLMIQLPESICRMSNLSVLGLESCINLTKLPTDIKNMKGLVHVYIRNCDNLNCMPQGIGSLARLRTLQLFSLDGGSGSGRIGELDGLKSLEGELSIYNLKEVRDAAEAREARLQEKQGLRKLTLSWGGQSSSSGSHDRHEQQHHQMLDEGVLEELRPPIEIRELSIQGFMTIRSLPSWMADPMFSNLSYLEIINLGGLRRIGPDQFCGGRGTFPVLKQLKLFDLPSLEEWTTCVGGASSDADGCVDLSFPSLEELYVEDCPKLRALPSSSSFPVLKRLKLYRLPSLEEWTTYIGGPNSDADGCVDVSFPSLEELRVRDCLKLRALPSPSSFPVLKQLKLYDLPSLEEWTTGIGGASSDADGCVDVSFPSLEELRVRDCLKLRALPSPSSFPVLKQLQLSDLPSLEEWTTCVGGAISDAEGEVDASFPSLEELVVRGCPKLRALPPPSAFPAVMYLIMDYDNLLTCIGGGGGFQSLKDMRLLCCNGRESPPEAILHQCNSIRVYSTTVYGFQSLEGVYP